MYIGLIFMKLIPFTVKECGQPVQSVYLSAISVAVKRKD